MGRGSHCVLGEAKHKVSSFYFHKFSIPYAWSVFNAPIAKEFSDVGQATLQFAFTVFMISYGAFGIVGGW